MSADASDTYVVGKALAYIVRGRSVLVLRDLAGRLAGLGQVPGGTMEPGETPEEAVLREAFEETGLEGLRIVAKVGYLEMPCPVHEREIQHRHYFHMAFDGDVPDGWEHVEATPSCGSPPIPLALAFEPLDGTDLGLWAAYG
ncbi:MAG TPA: NUDIX domain-containing protein, partial [bacterium]|nr:NUDIX domain-containing protein [bacterium]